ncbi:MAG: hypothetical protein JWM83_1290, partial [Candidatus Angelobacter sp.]|nr:hypothetical protein [Candidatus Angelobacter sp.]
MGKKVVAGVIRTATRRGLLPLFRVEQDEGGCS